MFVNTSHPDKRIFLLKHPGRLKNLPDNSADIGSDNLIKQYQRRPEALENLCLADFATLFDIQYHKAKPSMEKSAKDDLLPEDQAEENLDDDTCNLGENDYDGEYRLKCGTVIKRKCTPKILRYVRLSELKDPENFYREQLILFVPWSGEVIDLLKDCDTYKE